MVTDGMQALYQVALTMMLGVTLPLILAIIIILLIWRIR